MAMKDGTIFASIKGMEMKENSIELTCYLSLGFIRNKEIIDRETVVF